jgi:hypothetical protein
MASSAKGIKREYEISVALWVDLLGYGSMLQGAAWDPTSEQAEAALERIVNFQKVVSRHSMRNFPTFVMNDGAVAFRDLSPRTNAVTFDFLRRAVELHTAINAQDQALGHPGARAVLAAGFRVRRTIDYSSRLNSGEGKAIKKKLGAGLMPVDQAINHALMARHHCDSTPLLQHNYAMTKAYLAESAGSRGGFEGAELFIDMNIIGSEGAPWIKFEKQVSWSGRGMSGEFGLLSSLDSQAAQGCGYAGIRNAFEVAPALSANPEILQIIRASRVGDLRKQASE